MIPPGTSYNKITSAIKKLNKKIPTKYASKFAELAKRIVSQHKINNSKPNLTSPTWSNG